MAKGFKRKYFSLAAIAATVSMNLLQAQAAQIEQIEKVVVSASKVSEDIEETTEDIEVIDAEELQERGIETLKELVEYITGASVNSYGGPGKLTTFHLRGMNLNQTLVLIDGIRFNDPSNFNKAQLEHILLDDVDRVEIVKGAQSSIWGADAAAGVINIITKKAKTGIHSIAKIEKGSFDTKKGSFTASYKSEHYFFQTDLSYFDTDGFSAITPYNENPKDYESDGYINRTFKAKGGLQLQDFKAELGAIVIDANNEADGYSGGRPDPNSISNDTYNYKALYLNVNKNVSAHTLSFHTDHTETTREYISYKTKYKGKTDTVEFRDLFKYAKASRLLTGLVHQKFYARYADSFSTKRYDYTNSAIYIANKNRFDKLILSENVRYDNYSDFDNQVTGKIGVKYMFPKLSVSANYGTAYRVPSPLEIDNPFGASNPNLQPEKSRGFDIGVAGYGLKIRYFEERVKDLIKWYIPEAVFKNFSGTSRFKGWEISYTRDLFDQFLLNLGYTQLQPEDAKGDEILGRAKFKYTYSLTWYPTSKHTINIDGYYVGSKIDAVQKRQIGKYNVTNLSASHHFAKNFTGFIRIKNIFDRRYQEVYGYGGWPRSYYIGIKGSF